jgi:hypothetical protein
MGVTADRNVIVTNIDGTETVFTAKDKLRGQTILSFVCDSPRCSARHEGKATFLTWDEELAQKDISNLPEGFFRLIKIQPDPLNGEYNIFVCSPTCAKDYLVFSYVPPKSPRQLLQEKSEEFKVNAAAVQAMEEANPQMTLPFDQEPDSDATGYAE